MKNILLLFSVILLLYSCVKKECQIAGGYHIFEIPVNFSPTVDTIHLGDTIDVESRFNQLVYDRSTDQSYLLENFQLTSESRIIKIDENPANRAALENFEVIVGDKYDLNPINYSSGTIGLIGKYESFDGEYSVQYKLIPKVKGLYVFSHNCLVLDENQFFEGKCPNVLVGALPIINNSDSEGNNVDILLNSPDPHYSEWILVNPEDRFNGSYAFYVK